MKSIREHNAPKNNTSPYNVEDVGNEIVNNPVAFKAYQRINDQGYDVRINYDIPDEINDAGVTRRGEKNVDIWQMNNWNKEQAVGTMVHESTHIEYRHQKRRQYNSQYEEYRAFVREELYYRSKNPNKQTRPTMKKRRQIWEDVKERYPLLPQGKYPFGGNK